MVVKNDLDRFHLVGDVIQRVPSLGPRAAYVEKWLRDRLSDHHAYIIEHGEDPPEIKDWRWPGKGKGGAAVKPKKRAVPKTSRARRRVSVR